ncbi:MAG: hypothetical protein K2Z81_09275 [Cyanobacteria bacterium]|nr:hypothetical protein [Cyanobacteriota bacterium]
MFSKKTIKLAGEADGLNFQPHPVIGSATAIISTDKSVFELAVAEAGGYYIKSVKRNGDALFTAPQPPMPTEVKFGPVDSSAKFRWAFDRAD